MWRNCIIAKNPQNSTGSLLVLTNKDYWRSSSKFQSELKTVEYQQTDRWNATENQHRCNQNKIGWRTTSLPVMSTARHYSPRTSTGILAPMLRIRIRIRIRIHQIHMFFGPPGSGSGSISQRYGSGSGSGSFYHQAKIVRKTLIPTALWPLFYFLSLKMM